MVNRITLVLVLSVIPKKMNLVKEEQFPVSSLFLALVYTFGGNDQENDTCKRNTFLHLQNEIRQNIFSVSVFLCLENYSVMHPLFKEAWLSILQ